MKLKCNCPNCKNTFKVDEKNILWEWWAINSDPHFHEYTNIEIEKGFYKRKYTFCPVCDEMSIEVEDHWEKVE